MIYKFHSRATGDVIMLGPHGDQMLRLLGRTPAAQGIVEAADMPAAIATLQAAIDAEDTHRPEGAAAGKDEDDDAEQAKRVALGPRLWPIIEMFKRAHTAGEPVVWGV